MKTGERIWQLVKELELKGKPINKEMCFDIFESTMKFDKIAEPVFEIVEIMGEIKNIRFMIDKYKPKRKDGPGYGWNMYQDDEWNYTNTHRERLKLIAALRKLRSALDKLEHNSESAENSA